MVINIEGKNEHVFIPDIADNKETKPTEQWRIIVKKLNYKARILKYTYTKTDGSTGYDDQQYLRDSIVRFENAPDLQNEKSEKIRLTVEELLNDTYPELFPVVQGLSNFVNNLLVESSEVDVKK